MYIPYLLENTMYSIKTLNNIATAGLDQFHRDQYTVSQNVLSPDAIILRSYPLHDVAIPPTVQVIGRAGAGTNNIPIDTMTGLGIPVFNTPGANANAVKELVITGLLLASRHICSAWDYARHIEGDNQQLHEQVEKNKKKFSGVELPGKTLGVIGLGHIGVKVANAARYLGMHVVGYDPAMTVKNAWELRSSVQQAEQLEDVLRQADFISVHVPLIDATRHLINAQRLKTMKKGAVLLNLARDGIVDNTALLNALAEKHISTYVCDFPNDQFQQHPQVIALPHLGASTKEAEENCAIMIVQQVKDFLENGHIQHAVNFPRIKMTRKAGHRLTVVNQNIPNMVAQITAALSDANINIIDMINKSRDRIAYTLLDVSQDISDDTLKQLTQIDGIIHVRKISP